MQKKILNIFLSFFMHQRYDNVYRQLSFEGYKQVGVNIYDQVEWHLMSKSKYSMYITQKHLQIKCT
jgi:hypothetical protein